MVNRKVAVGVPSTAPNRVSGKRARVAARARPRARFGYANSLRDAREMLSDTVAFWMVPELANKNWDAGAVDIPGLTTGFPPGVTGYPALTLK